MSDHEGLRANVVEATSCHLCGEPVVVGPDERGWGMQWFGLQWIHFHCAENLGEAAYRVQGKVERAAALSRLEASERDYHDLLLQVGSKYPGETRHETAKRYIVEGEARGDDTPTAAQPEEG